MQIRELLALPSNYTKNPDNRKIKYIVIHYTGNNGDTAEANCKYFRNNYVGASAHYFVDAAEVWRSVPDESRAWHCGADFYYHDECRNNNSLGIELCSRKDNTDAFYFLPETMELAAELVREKMAEYNIPIENVIRHFDVTHKNCPAPFVMANAAYFQGSQSRGDELTAWQNFKKLCSGQQKPGQEATMRYNKLGEIPSWAKDTIEKLIKKGIIQGDGQNLDLSKDMVRMLVYNDRAGLYGK